MSEKNKKSMNEHAASHGLSHWKCIDENGNSRWRRDDGLVVYPKFEHRTGYLWDLRQADINRPMSELGAVAQSDLTIAEWRELIKPLFLAMHRNKIAKLEIDRIGMIGELTFRFDDGDSLRATSANT